MKKNWDRFLNLLLALIIIYALYTKIPMWIDNYQREGQVGDTFEVQKLSGEKVGIPLAEKGIYIFWATWCGPCKMEMTRFQKAIAANEISAQQVHAISMGEDPELIRKTIAEEGYTFQFYLDQTGAAQAKYPIRGTPTIYHIDESRKIHKISTGVSPFTISSAKDFLKSPPPGVDKGK